MDLEYIIKRTQKDILLLFDEIEQITPKLGMKENWRDGDDFVKSWQTIRSNFYRWGNNLFWQEQILQQLSRFQLVSMTIRCIIN